MNPVILHLNIHRKVDPSPVSAAHQVRLYILVVPKVLILCTGRLSTKSNVYTFGAVLLELLSGIQAPHRRNQEKQYFSKKKKLVQIMDARLDGQYSQDAAYEVAKLALKCLSLDPKSRPSMADVVAALQLLRAAA